MRKILTLLLCMMMVVVYMPTMVFATDDGAPANVAEAEEGVGGGYTTTNIAQVGETEYPTLQDAVDAVEEGEITLLADTDISASGLNIPANKNITLNLNGNEVKIASTEDGQIYIEGSLTINNSSETGKIYSDTVYEVDGNVSDAICVDENGSLTLNGGEIDTVVESDGVYDGSFAVGVYENGTVTINNGTIRAGMAAISGNDIKDQNITINVNGGELISYNYVGIWLQQNGTTNISGGRVEGITGVDIDAGTLNVTGGEIVATDEFVIPETPFENGNDSYGSAIRIGNKAVFDNLVGVYISETARVTASNGPAISQYDDGEESFATHGGEILISGGEITAGGEHGLFSMTPEAVAKTKVSGGTFSQRVPEECLAEGCVVKTLTDDRYEVVRATIEGDWKNKKKLLVGKTYQVVFSGGNNTVTWESDHPEYATVNENGLVTALAPGDVAISMKKNEMIICQAEFEIIARQNPEAYVAEVDGTEYQMLEDAVAAISGTGTITLLADTDISGSGIVISEDKNITLNLNGNDIKAANTDNGQIRVEGALTIEDRSEEPGRIYSEIGYTYDCEGYDIVSIEDNGSLTLNSGEIYSVIGDNPAEDGYYAVGVYDNGTVTVNGGKIESGWSAISGNGSTGQNTTININGGQLISLSDACIWVPQNGTTNISGGRVEGITGVDIEAGTLNVTGGEIVATGEFETPETPSYDGINSHGSAIQIESNNSYDKPVGVYISEDAQLTTTNGPAISQYNIGDGTFESYDGEILISGGEITAGGEHGLFSMTPEAVAKTKVSGGTFSQRVPDEYLAEDYVVKTLTDGRYEVVLAEIVGDWENNKRLEVGETYQVEFSGDNDTVTWESDNDEIATVTDNGLVTAHAPGTVTISMKNDNGVTLCEAGFDIILKQIPDYDVAKVGEKGYRMLEDAVAEITGEGTITLIANTDISTSGLYIPEGKSITLNLNGNSVKAANTRIGMIEVQGNLTIEDNSEQPGKIFSETAYVDDETDSTSYAVIEVSYNGSLTLNSGEINTVVGNNPADDGNLGVGVSGAGVVTINGGMIKSGWYAVYGYNLDELENTTINVRGGEVISLSDSCFWLPQNGTTNISGGKVKGLTGVNIVSGTLNVTGGEIIATGEFETPEAPSDDGINSHGSAIQIESNDSCNKLVGVYISKNAKLTTTNGPAISQHNHFEGNFDTHGGEILISGGVISAGGTHDLFSLTKEAKAKTKVSGGTFSSRVPDEYVKEGFQQKEISNGKYTVYKPSPVGGNTPAGPSDNVTNSGTTGAGSATTTADVNTTTSGGTTSAVVDQTTADKIVDNAISNQSTEVVVDVTTGAGTAGNTTVTLPTDTVQKLADKTKAEVTVKTDAAELTLDQKAVEAVASKAAGATVEILVEKTKDETKEMEFELKVVSNGTVIGEFDGGNVKVTVKLNSTLKTLKDAVLTCVYIDDNGRYSKVGGKKNDDGTFTFVTNHFSSYAIMTEEEADAVIEAQVEKLLKGLEDIDLTARSVRTSKGNVKVTLKVDKAGKAIIDELKEAGYTVKYNFYRSTKKKAGYASKKIKEATSYTNTQGKKGTLYYYKARVQVYDAGGKLVARTALKDCRYASRLWKK